MTNTKTTAAIATIACRRESRQERSAASSGTRPARTSALDQAIWTANRMPSLCRSTWATIIAVKPRDDG